MNAFKLYGQLTAPIVERNSKKGVFHTFNLVETIDEHNKQYFSCTCFDNEIMNAMPNVNKGDLVAVLGSLRQSKYEKNGSTHIAYNVVVDKLYVYDENGEYAEVKPRKESE